MAEDAYIAGVWRVAQGEAFASIDPALGGEVWRGRAAGHADVAAAFTAAEAAFSSWAAAPLETRIALCRRFAAELEARKPALAERISRETGKPLWESLTEVQAMIAKVDISIRAQAERAGESRADAAFGATELRHRPHGVLAVLGPYNFPGHLPNGHIVPALLAGNTVVFKPSELTPGVAALTIEAWAAAGAPAGVINLAQGARETGVAVLADPRLAGVLFTGSYETGRAIHAQFAGRPEVLLALEMGGNNPLIVWPPCDPAAAANLIVHSAFATSGQRCSCARRLVLPADRSGDEVLAALAALAAGLRVGAWNAAPAPFMGPLVRERAARRAETQARALVQLGGREIVPIAREGAVFRPAVIDMTDVAPAPDEEIFAPVLQVFRVPTFEEACARANATRFGLAAGFIGDDPAHWEAVRSTVRAGVLNWNRPTTGASSALPFGGPGCSGNLRPSAYYAADYCAYPVATQAAAKAAPIPAEGLPQ